MNIVVVDSEERSCQMCGKVDELRPYGPNGEAICYNCGMKDEATVKKKFEELLEETDFFVIGDTAPFRKR